MNQVYVQNIFLEEIDVYVSILDMYFSERGEVIVKLSKKEIVFTLRT